MSPHHVRLALLLAAALPAWAQEHDDAEARMEAVRALQEERVPPAALIRTLEAARRERDRAGRPYATWPLTRAALARVPDGVWINLGPTRSNVPAVPLQDAGPEAEIAGRIRSVVPHPSEPGVLFIATSGGGVWKTWDGGASWEPITDQLLSWKLSGASTARLAGQDVDPGQGGLQVFPTQDTTYQLVARREEGTLTANALVRVGLPPVITAFSASPDPVPRGTATALSWQAPGAQTFSLGGGAGPGYAGPLHGAKVRPLTSTRYTLTATNAFGSATRDLDVAVSGPLGSKLVYTDPPSGSEALRLVKSSASTDVGVVLQLVSTGAAPALDGIALNLPLDGAAPGSRDGIARIALSPQSVSFGGLDVTSGSATPAAGLALPGRGLLAGVLTLGMAQKPSAAGGPAGDAPLPAGTVLATFRLDLQPAGGTGLALDGTTGTGFRLRLRSRSGEVAGTVAVGKLEVQ